MKDRVLYDVSADVKRHAVRYIYVVGKEAHEKVKTAGVFGQLVVSYSSQHLLSESK